MMHISRRSILDFKLRQAVLEQERHERFLATLDGTRLKDNDVLKFRTGINDIVKNIIQNRDPKKQDINWVREEIVSQITSKVMGAEVVVSIEESETFSWVKKITGNFKVTYGGFTYVLML
jgi:Asp-tRNA(Asn)/Glu-tRNA(Gln) amidotransferase B subunit